MKFYAPLPESHIVTQSFGPSNLMINGVYVYKDRFHYGTDFRAKTGTPVRSTSKGIVIYAKYDDSYRKNVIIKDSLGYLSRLAHLSVIYVKVGEAVDYGDNIGLSGNTGRWTTAAHLHWDIKLNSKYIDPMTVITYNIKEVKKDMITRDDINTEYQVILDRQVDEEGAEFYLDFLNKQRLDKEQVLCLLRGILLSSKEFNDNFAIRKKDQQQADIYEFSQQSDGSYLLNIK